MNMNINININSFKKAFFSITSIIIFSSVIISGCSQKVTPSFLRNRDFDYQRHSVVQPKPISIPKDIKEPSFLPLYKLPKGQNIFPESKNGEVIAVLPPPGFPTKMA